MALRSTAGRHGRTIDSASNSAHQENVQGSTQRASQMESKTRQGQILNPAGLMGGQSGAEVYPHSLHNAQWLRTDHRRDRILELKKELAASGKNGQVSITDEDLNYLASKEDELQNLNHLQLASFLIDPKRPETQEYAEEIYSELRDYPEAQAANNLVLQEALRVMLTRGRVSGKEDNALIAHILRDDVQLPVSPLWDAVGVLQSAATASKINLAELISGNAKRSTRGMFNPKGLFGRPTDEKMTAEMRNLQRQIKHKIVQRLYPGMEKYAVDSAVMHQFYNQSSPFNTVTKTNNLISGTGEPGYPKYKDFLGTTLINPATQ